MFDTVAGLPVHVLVVHAVVVLGPLAGLAAVAYALRPTWRTVLRWPLVVLAVAAAATALVATESGEALERRIGSLGVSDGVRQAIREHSERGELARTVAIAVLVVTVAAVTWLLRPAAPGPGGRAATVVAASVLAVAGVALVVVTVLAGHSGSSVVWSEIGRAEVTSGGG